MASSRRCRSASTTSASAAACAACAAAARSSSVNARGTCPVRAPLLALISVRARSRAFAGSVSPQTWMPPSSQQ